MPGSTIHFLGHFAMDTLIHIPAKGEFRLPVKLQVDMSKIIKNSLVAFLAKEVIIKVEGKARLEKDLFLSTTLSGMKGKQNLGELLK